MKLRLSGGPRSKSLLIWGGVFALIGLITLVISLAAPGDPDGNWYNISPSNISANPSNPHDNYGFNSIVIHPTNPSTLYMGTNYQGLWRSTNAGVSWTKINTGSGGSMLDQGRLWALAIDPHNPNIIWTSSGYGAGGPLKSTDGGVSWTKMPAGSPTQYDDVYSIAIDPHTPNHILLAWHAPWSTDGSNSGVSESFNGGQTWTNHQPPAGSNWGAGNAVFFMDNSQTWLVGSQSAGIWRTTNSGGSWTRVESRPIEHGATFFMTKYGNTYYAAVSRGSTSQSGVISSSNGGSTWTDISSGFPQWNGPSNVASDGTYLYTSPSFPSLSGYANGGFAWYRRPISGGNWTAMTNLPNVCHNTGGGTVCNGPVGSAYDATNKIAYTVNWNGGVWKLRAGTSGGGTCPAGTTGTPPNCTPTSNKFETLPVNAQLPTESDCAARVKPRPEVRSTNAAYNNDNPPGGNYLHPGVTGNYHGTTDEIIQWAACKWGMDEDVLRAQAVQESYWTQNGLGDWTSDGTQCSNLYPIGNYPGHTGQCPESYGLLQVRWHYHKSAFYSSATENSSTLTNNAIYSTAYNADYYARIWRNCYNGNEGWLNQFERGRNYAAGDMWGCVGMWFSGRWYTDPANQYIANVQNNLNNRVWETSSFINYQPTGIFLTRPGSNPPPPSDTTPPTVTFTIPGLTLSGSDQTLIVRNLKEIRWQPTSTDSSGISSVTHTVNGQTISLTNGEYRFGSASNGNGDYILRTVSRDNNNNTTTRTVTIRLRHPDFDRNGTVGLTDLSRLLSGYGAASTNYDLDANGTVGLFDLSFLLGQYGSTQ